MQHPCPSCFYVDAFEAANSSLLSAQRTVKGTSVTRVRILAGVLCTFKSALYKIVVVINLPLKPHSLIVIIFLPMKSSAFLDLEY